MERLNTDMRATSLSISKECRSETNLTLHSIYQLKQVAPRGTNMPHSPSLKLPLTRIRRIENYKQLMFHVVM
jgi:hypothetical protein